MWSAHDSGTLHVHQGFQKWRNSDKWREISDRQSGSQKSEEWKASISGMNLDSDPVQATGRLFINEHAKRVDRPLAAHFRDVWPVKLVLSKLKDLTFPWCHLVCPGFQESDCGTREVVQVATDEVGSFVFWQPSLSIPSTSM